MPSPSRSTSTVLAVVIFFLLIASSRHYLTRQSTSYIIPSPHPIPSLLASAAAHQDALRTRRSTTLAQAHARYLASTKRLPPPGFDQWFAASQRDHVCNIDEFDKMRESLEIWWAIEPKEIRRRQDALLVPTKKGDPMNGLGRVRVRKGKVMAWKEMEAEGGYGYGNHWKKEGDYSIGRETDARRAVENMVEWVSGRYGQQLPDMDFVVNGLDEPRIVMPHELITTLREHLAQGTIYHPPKEGELLYLQRNPTAYSILRNTCPPNSLARLTPLSSSPGSPYSLSQNHTSTFTTPLGNFLTSPAKEQLTWCDQPELQDLHASFVRPLSFQVLDQVWPVFSNSKLEGYNDILVPAWFYWIDAMRYEEDKDPDWEEKKPQLFWRGTNTGGYSEGTTYLGWARARFISLLSSPVSRAVPLYLPYRSSNETLVVSLPSDSISHSLTDCALTSPDTHGTASSLASQLEEPSFRFSPSVPFAENFGSKAIADLDGTAYSGRYLSLLKSKSAVFKARLYQEALEATLVPWYHYVPLSMRYTEVHNLLVYFFGADKVVKEMGGWTAEGQDARRAGDRDAELKAIGEQGREWAKRCGRREDMVSYMWLLALEWGRLTSDERETLGLEL